jgi:hypothetical protein
LLLLLFLVRLCSKSLLSDTPWARPGEFGIIYSCSKWSDIDQRRLVWSMRTCIADRALTWAGHDPCSLGLSPGLPVPGLGPGPGPPWARAQAPEDGSRARPM